MAVRHGDDDATGVSEAEFETTAVAAGTPSSETGSSYESGSSYGAGSSYEAGPGGQAGPAFGGGPVTPDPTEVARLRKVRRRRRRQTATFVVFFLLIAGVGAGAYMAYQGRIDLPIGSGKPSPLPTCPPAAEPTVLAPKNTSVNVFNASDRRGLALQVARDLQKRGFKVPTQPTNDPRKTKVDGAAVIRHGATGLAAARAVAAVVDGPVVLVPDARTSGDVDLVLGQAFKLKPTGTASGAASPAGSQKPTSGPSSGATPAASSGPGSGASAGSSAGSSTRPTGGATATAGSSARSSAGSSGGAPAGATSGASASPTCVPAAA